MPSEWHLIRANFIPTTGQIPKAQLQTMQELFGKETVN